MTRGTITRLVNTHGSAWGKIQTPGSSHDVFFNLASLTQPADFGGLLEGQEVEFDEESDRVNGACAVHLVTSAS